MKKSRTLLAIISLIITLPAAAVDFANAWFQPELETNKSPVCEQLEQYTKRIWRGELNTHYPTGSFNKEDRRDFSVELKGKSIHIKKYRHNGCGGGCEQLQIMASSNPFPNQRKNRDFYTPLFESSPPAGDVQFLSAQGMYFVLSKNNTENTLFKLDENALWNKVCAVRKTPTKEQIAKTKGDFENMQQSLTVLRGLVGNMRQSVGSNCGSLWTHGRWSNRINEEFGLLLHAPRLKPKASKYYDDSTNDINLKSLTLWSLQGIGEFESFTQYQKTLSNVIAELSQFYQKHFSWSKVDADSTADYTLTLAISSGIRFYGHKPFKSPEEIALRKAILSNQPMSEIKNIDISSIDKSPKNSAYNTAESVLNIAVTYPQAMDYLLEAGFDANHKNTFHKTPLMYAAQHNGYQAAQKLIEHGAAVNAATIIPVDTCNYALSTSDMSPLHYAVRYADKNLIELLINNGASKFHNVDNRSERPNRIEYPLDWLSRFENPLLTGEDKQYIEEKLKLPSDEEKVALAKKINLQGEKHYSEKAYPQAAASFFEATQMENKNIRALNNYALVLLKLGDKERSLEVSKKVIRLKSASNKEKASAYFNSGLACDGAGKRGINYNGNRYCRDGVIGEYIAAYKNHPTKSRANAIIERLMSKKSEHEHQCIVASEKLEAVYKMGRSNLLFLHKKPMEVDLEEVTTFSRERKSVNIQARALTLKHSDTQDLQNGYYLSSYTSSATIYDNFAIAEGVCTSASPELMSESAYKDLLIKKS